MQSGSYWAYREAGAFGDVDPDYDEPDTRVCSVCGDVATRPRKSAVCRRCARELRGLDRPTLAAVLNGEGEDLEGVPF